MSRLQSVSSKHPEKQLSQGRPGTATPLSAAPAAAPPPPHLHARPRRPQPPRSHPPRCRRRPRPADPLLAALSAPHLAGRGRCPRCPRRLLQVVPTSEAPRGRAGPRSQMWARRTIRRRERRRALPRWWERWWLRWVPAAAGRGAPPWPPAAAAAAGRPPAPSPAPGDSSSGARVRKLWCVAVRIAPWHQRQRAWAHGAAQGQATSG